MIMQKIVHDSSEVVTIFDLVAILWRGKFSILVVAIIGGFCAMLYAFTVKEEWKSEAQIIPPQITQLGSYLDVQKGYDRFSELKNNLNIEDSKRLEEIASNSFRTLILMLGSIDNKQEYLLNSEYYKKQLNKLTDDFAKRKLLIEMAEKDLNLVETNRDKNNSYEVSYVAETAEDAQETLQAYIDYSNKKAFDKIFNDLDFLINERILTLENNAAALRFHAEQTRKNNILTLKQAIAVAKDAEIKEYTGQNIVTANTRIDIENSSAENFSNAESLFLLGEKYLTAQLKAMEASPIIYPANYYQMLGNIKELRQLLDYKRIGSTFEYTKTPSLPLSKDKPKRILMLLVGLVCGFIFGCLYVLLIDQIRKNGFIVRKQI